MLMMCYDARLFSCSEALVTKSRSYRRRFRRRRVIERLAVASQLQALNELAGPPAPAPTPVLEGMDLSDNENPPPTSARVDQASVTTPAASSPPALVVASQATCSSQASQTVPAVIQHSSLGPLFASCWVRFRIDFLPPHHLQEAHMLQHVPPPLSRCSSVVLFRQEQHPLSNFFPFNFVYQGRLFSSAEHAYQFTKAVFLGEHELAAVIQSAKTAAKAKQFAASLTKHPRYPEWFTVRIPVMCLILEHKFCSCPSFFTMLQEQPTPYLVENTSHPYWAAGRVISNTLALDDVDDLPGQNVLGRLLMRLADHHTLLAFEFQDKYRLPASPVSNQF